MELRKIAKNIYKKIFMQSSEFSDLWKIKPDDRILILSTQPNEETIGCGGLLTLFPKQCDVICFITEHYGDSERNSGEPIQIEKTEFEEVMQKTGVNSFEIAEAEYTMPIKTKPELDLEKYTYILIPSPDDAHIEHITLSKFFKKYYKKYYKKVVYYEIWGAISKPNRFLDISNVINKKQEHINLYKSHVKHMDYFDRISALNRYRGIIPHVDYAEAYQFVKKN